MSRIVWRALLLGLVLGCAPAQGQLTVDFLDVGQGDAILIRSPEGKTALIDAGPSRDVAALLKRKGVTTLDLVVVSHHHADHYGGMAEVIAQFHPRYFLASGSSHTSEQYLRLLQRVRDQGIPTLAPSAQGTRKIALGTATLTVFPQAPDDRSEENNNSIGLRLQYGAFSVLFPGDAQAPERAWWERVVPTLCADATVLKVAHHGSRNGTDFEWLRLVRPRIAVVSLGKDNEYGHPHPQTLSMLARSQIPLYRTDRDGTITVRSDGTNWQVLGRRPLASGAPPASRRPYAGPRADTEVKPKSKPPVGSIDVNRATEEELQSIPGIGPVLSRRIIAGRPYATLDALDQVKGIGKKRLSELRPYLRIR